MSSISQGVSLPGGLNLNTLSSVAAAMSKIPNMSNGWSSTMIQNMPNSMSTSLGVLHPQQNAREMPLSVQSMPPFFFPNSSASIGPGSMSHPFPPPATFTLTHTDDEMVIKALATATNNDKNYKEALESLHEMNDIPYEIWRQHYLVHKFRLDRAVSLRLQETVIEPDVSVEQLPHNKSESFSTAPGIRRVQRLPTPLFKDPISLSTRSRNLRFIDQRQPSSSINLTVFSSGDKTEASSRSSTPPYSVVARKNPNPYTVEDQKYFIAFVRWQLKVNPQVTKTQICSQLGERTPHHSGRSWEWYWDSVDGDHKRIFAKVKAKLERFGSPIRPPAASSSKRRIIESSSDRHSDEINVDNDISEDEYDSGSDLDNYASESNSSDILTVSRSRSVIGSSRVRRAGRHGLTSVRFPNIDSNLPAPTEKRNMGKEGETYTEADIRLLALHIASNPNLSTGEVLRTFHNTYRTRSGAGAWKKVFTRYEADLKPLIQIYRAKLDGSEDQKSEASRYLSELTTLSTKRSRSFSPSPVIKKPRGRPRKLVF